MRQNKLYLMKGNMIKAILFDLDGTLLPMDNDLFVEAYFSRLAKKLAPYGYEPQKLVDGIWAGTAAMVKNDGSCTNEEAFWNRFSQIFGEECRQDEPVFADFYAHEFQEAKEVCGYTPEAAQVIALAKSKGYRVTLATNPIFPAIATESRMKWAGLNKEDFELYTTYENIGLCKPNPEYYREILRRMNLQAEECVMVGNDAVEDMVASALGMKVFLLTDHLLNKKNTDISVYPQGGFRELMEFIEAL